MTRRIGKRSSLPFLALPHYVLKSPAFRTLSPPATKLLLAIGEKFYGDNNGELEMPFGELVRDWHYNSRHTIARAIRELLSTSLLIRTRKGRSYGSPEPSLYALGWHPIPASEQHAVREIAARFTPQVQNASAPNALDRRKQVHLEHLEGQKMPFSSQPENEVMRVSQVHCTSDQVHQEHYLSRSMPGMTHKDLRAAIESLPADLVLSGCEFQKTPRACVPIGGASITPAQINASEYMTALVQRYCYFDIRLHP